MNGFNPNRQILCCITLLAFVFGSANVFGIGFEEIMSQQDQRVTGVWRLSKMERRALEKWLTIWAKSTAEESKTFKEGMNLQQWVLKTLPKDIDLSEFAENPEEYKLAPPMPTSSSSDAGTIPSAEVAPSAAASQAAPSDDLGTAPARSSESKKTASSGGKLDRLNVALERWWQKAPKS